MILLDKKKVFFCTFVILHLAVPLTYKDLFPFSSFPMFSDNSVKCLVSANFKSRVKHGFHNYYPIELANNKPRLGCGVESVNFSQYVFTDEESAYADDLLFKNILKKNNLNQVEIVKACVQDFKVKKIKKVINVEH